MSEQPMTRRQLRALRERQGHEGVADICAVARRAAVSHGSAGLPAGAAATPVLRRTRVHRSTLFRSAQAKAVTGALIAFGLGFTTAVPAYAVSPSVSATVDLSSVDYSQLADREAELVASGALEPQALTASSGLVSAADGSTVGAEARAVARVTATQACDSGVSTLPVDVETAIPLPAGSYTVTSRPGARWGRQHNGVDMAASLGTPIYAAMSGEVIFAGDTGVNPGILIRTFLSDGTQVDHLYLHSPMSSFTVSTGDHVNVGDQIAVVGAEGNSTGAHLHFEVRLNGGASAGPAYGGQVIDGLAWITQRDAYVMPACS